MFKTIAGWALVLLTSACGSVWAAEVYVDGGNPAAADSNVGTAAAPVRTINRGLGLLRPGDTLTIRAGVYRESLRLPSALLNQSTRGARTTIQGAPGAEVVIKGSVLVTEWEQARPGLYSTRWDVEPQQVFVDGKPLQQIGGNVFTPYPELEEQGGVGDIWPGRVDGDQYSMPAGSFYYDGAARRLYVRPVSGTLQGRQVEVSAIRYLLFGENANNFVIRNLTFEHSNTTLDSRAGAVTLIGNNNLLESLRVRHVDGTGINLQGNDNILRNSVMTHAGQLGLKATGERVLIENNETSYNNTRGFNKWFEAGGAKFMGNGGLRNSTLRNHRAYFNNGDGVWFDWDNRHNLVTGSVFIGNSGFGIHYEASSYGVIVNNISARNGQRGIYLPHSHHMVVAHNLVADSGLSGLVIIDEGRQDPSGSFSLRPSDNTIAANIFVSNRNNAIRLPDNIVRTVSTENVLVGSGATFARGWSGAPTALDSWRGQTGLEAGTIQLQDAWGSRSASDQAGELTALYVKLNADIRSRLAPLQRLTQLPADVMREANDKAGPSFSIARPSAPVLRSVR